MKVKRLTEENGNGEEKSDLGKSEEIVIKEEEKIEVKDEPETLSPEPVVSRERVLSEESDRDNQSVNQSNGNLETVAVKSENEASPLRTGDENPEPADVSPVREDSCNGSSDSRTKEPVLELVKVEPDGEVSNSPELRASMAESKSGEGTKEFSDVQSSASKSMKEGSDKVHRSSSRDDERENEHEDPATKGLPFKSQPLIDFFQKVRSLGLGSTFERRLESQENLKYKNLIRRHINLEIVQTRLKEGWYSDDNDKFFRDLLLLVNNTLIFFGKESSESVAAIEFRQLISKEMAKRNKMTDSSAVKQLSSPLVTVPSKRAPEPSNSLLLKPKIAGPMIVCRKRSSIAAKASASASGADRKKEQTTALAEEKQIRDLKQSGKFSEEHQIMKKKTKDEFASFAKKNGNEIRAKTSPNKTLEVILNQNQGKVSPCEQSETKSERKKKIPIEEDGKKQSAGKFLNRLKQSSSSSKNGSLIDTVRGLVVGGSENDSRGGEQKRGGNKGDERIDQVPKRSLGGRQSKDLGSPAKRSVGRPPKRAAAPPPLLSVSGKRGRGVGQTESMRSKQTKKRSKK